jgi:hypothetical protein
MAIANNSSTNNRRSSYSQKARTLFYPDRNTWILFAFFAIFGGGFFASFFLGDMTTWLIFLYSFYFIIYPISLAFGSVILDKALLPVTIPLVFSYLYFLSCLISYGLRWVREQDKRHESFDNQS